MRLVIGKKNKQRQAHLKAKRFWLESKKNGVVRLTETGENQLKQSFYSGIKDELLRRVSSPTHRGKLYCIYVLYLGLDSKKATFKTIANSNICINVN